MAKYKADDIANWLLRYNDLSRDFNNIEDTEDITNLKLQKLLYYCQGVYIGTKDVALFDEKIYAWLHGPVVIEVYNKYKKFSGKGITEYDENIEIDEETEKILISVYNYFSQYSAWGLRKMTHEEAPWKNTERNKEIEIAKIKEFFKENYTL